MSYDIEYIAQCDKCGWLNFFPKESIAKVRLKEHKMFGCVDGERK